MMTTRQSWQKYILILILIILCALSVLRSVSKFLLSADPASYIAAAQNLVRTGHLFVYTNAPSWSMEPVIEPYTEQPFGFPAYLAPFLLIIGQPILAAVAAQALAIMLLYAAVWVLAQDFQVGPGFQVAWFLAITLFRPLNFIFIYPLSETLFTALTLWAIHFLITIPDSRKPELAWLAALLAASAATSVRLIGILSLGLFILAIFLQPENRRRIRSSLLKLNLSILFVVGPLAAWFLRNQILYGVTSMSHGVENLFAWQTLTKPFIYLTWIIGPFPFLRVMGSGFILACLAVPFLMPGLANNANWRLTRLASRNNRWVRLLLGVIGVAVIGVSLVAEPLGFGGAAGVGLTQSAVIILGFLSIVVAWLVNTNAWEGFKLLAVNYDWNKWQSNPGFGYLLLLGAGLCQFLGITALSLVTPFSPLSDDRLLSSAVTVLLLAVLVGLEQLAGLGLGNRFRAVICSVAVVLAAFAPGFSKTEFLFTPGFRYPPEQQLWEEIKAYPGHPKVTHFYSDHNFTHQIYAQIPQRVINDENLLKGGYLDGLIGKGICPFVITETGFPVSQAMNQIYQGSGLTRYELMDGEFELFARDCLFNSE